MKFICNFVLALVFAFLTLTVASCGVASNVSQAIGFDQLVENIETLARNAEEGVSQALRDVLDEFLTEDETERVMSSAYDSHKLESKLEALYYGTNEERALYDRLEFWVNYQVSELNREN